MFEYANMPLFVILLKESLETLVKGDDRRISEERGDYFPHSTPISFAVLRMTIICYQYKYKAFCYREETPRLSPRILNEGVSLDEER